MRHGHCGVHRRVQRLGLGRGERPALKHEATGAGVRDAHRLRTAATAALLHDVKQTVHDTTKANTARLGAHGAKTHGGAATATTATATATATATTTAAASRSTSAAAGQGVAATGGIPGRARQSLLPMHWHTRQGQLVAKAVQ